MIQELKTHPRTENSPYPTIFDTMLNPNTEKGQYTPSDNDLTAEAILMLSAGMDTSANVLAQGVWYVLNDEKVYSKLFAELVEAIPNPSVMADYAALENLPYLVSSDLLRSWYP
jgi:cytochrome P450